MSRARIVSLALVACLAPVAASHAAPVLDFLTAFGGTGSDDVRDIAVDPEGNVYVTGRTRSNDFPTTPGALQETRAADGTNLTFVAKLSNDGSTLLWSTFLGAAELDGIAAPTIAVGADRRPVIAGYTMAADFPLVRPVDTRSASFQSAVVVKLSEDGSSVVYSTCLDGTSFSWANAVACDAAGNAYVIGETDARDFPVRSAFQHVVRSPHDGFIAKIASDGGFLAYSSLLGGSGGFTFPQAVTVAPDGTALVVGRTFSRRFPVTRGAFQQRSNDSMSGDGFAVRVSASGRKLLAATYLGGSTDDSARGVAIAANGDVIVTGDTVSTNFPLAAPLRSLVAGTREGFVTRMTPELSALVFSTLLGGNGEDDLIDVQVDSDDRVLVVGRTTSTDLTTVNPTQATLAGAYDLVVARLAGDGQAVDFATYLGGSGTEGGLSVALALDASDAAFLATSTDSTDLATVDPYQPFHGGLDGMIAKLLP